MNSDIAGIYTATLTPLNPDLSPNVNMLVDHCRSLLAQGSHGIALLGTTGEANSFSLTEKKNLIDQVISAGISADKLMVGTGSCAYTETAELTSFALDRGVNQILLLPPFYYPNVSDDGLLNYFERVISQVANDDIRICLYHFPKMTGIDMSMNLIEKLVTIYPRHFIGMKDSSGDLGHMLEVCRLFPGFALFAGTERFLIPVMKAGGAGCISATANITIGRIVELYQKYQTEEAETLQESLSQVRTVLEKQPLIAVLKQYLALKNHQPEWLQVRPPNSLISSTSMDECIEQLANLGFEPG